MRKFRCSVVELHDIAQETAEHVSVADAGHARRGHIDGVFAKIGHAQIAQQHPAVGVRIGAHAPVALGRKFGQFRFQAALLVEQFLGPVAFQPFFQSLRCSGLVAGSESGT